MRDTDMCRGIVLVSLIIPLAGCGLKRAQPPAPPRPADVVREAATAQGAIVPLAGVALDHPAPAALDNLDAAETAVAQHPDDTRAVLTLAYTYYKARAYNDAARTFEQAARLAPRDTAPVLYLGYTQMTIGALDAAIGTFTAVAKDKDVARDIQSEAQYQLGVCYAALQHDDKAVAAYTQAIGLNSKNGFASLALGGFAASKGRMEQARDFFQDAAKDLPAGRHKAQAHAGLGRLAEQQKDTKTATAEYKAALNLDRENEWAARGLKRLGAKG